ncbi:transcriptional repressor LexA [Tunturiibacter empetritectus]|uniref:transcriptional repressor LexA n=1 Tax=Tunturiibacter empetritectus TaxID=3069691 RepID=UPI003D9B4753
MAITRRQKEVIDFLSSFTQKNGYSPSYEEIASGLGLSSLATVHKHITNLQNKGLLQRAHNRSRSIDVLPARSGKKAPTVSPAGPHRRRQARRSNRKRREHLLSDIIGNREVFALEVRGDSMRDEHIVSGDYVLVERTRTAREGEIIVALIDGSDATLKRFYREGSMIRLQPSNTEMSPIYAPAANVSIQGKVLGVLRKYA